MKFDPDDWRDFDWRDIDFQRMRVLWIIPAVLLVFAAFTSVYTVQAESQGVVLRFGKYVRNAEPGLRFKLPCGWISEKNFSTPSPRWWRGNRASPGR